jgi:hypothetical protein
LAVDARHRVQSRSRFEQPVMRALRIAAQAVTHHCFNKFFVSASEREVRPPDAFCLAAVECERAQKVASFAMHGVDLGTVKPFEPMPQVGLQVD